MHRQNLFHVKQEVKQAVHTSASKLTLASNELHANNKEKGKVDEEELLFAFLIKRRWKVES